MKHKQKYRFPLLLIALIAVLSFSCNQLPEKTETTKAAKAKVEAVKQPQQKSADKTALAGNWIRTDADYRIQIADIHDGGKMKAGYFNPKSINVSEARWTDTNGILQVFIELTDANYPGSKYKLEYVKSNDMLSGQYYQAVEGTTYNVEFTRAK